MTKYRAMIGLEMHCEISKTDSKVFSSAKNGYTSKSNAFIRPLDMGFPGTLPRVNKEAVRLQNIYILNERTTTTQTSLKAIK